MRFILSWHLPVRVEIFCLILGAEITCRTSVFLSMSTFFLPSCSPHSWSTLIMATSGVVWGSMFSFTPFPVRILAAPDISNCSVREPWSFSIIFHVIITVVLRLNHDDTAPQVARTVLLHVAIDLVSLVVRLNLPSVRLLFVTISVSSCIQIRLLYMYILSPRRV